MDHRDPFSWDALLHAVQRDYPDLYRSWFTELEPAQLEAGQLGVRAADPVRARYLREQCSDAFVRAAMDQTGYLVAVRIDGPFQAQAASDTPSRRTIFICRPDGELRRVSASARSTDQDVACARRILSALARRAYRRPVGESDLRTLLGFYEQGRDRGGFDRGIEVALRRILASPEFLFRIERDPAAMDPSGVYRISDIELASRLSFFLWSSIPDDELRELAIKGQLRNPQTLAQQVKRMLADARADALVENFAGQWLYLRELETVQTEAKTFDENLRRSFRRETEMIFDAIIREDRSLIDLIDADYTFVDERLARHYGIPNVKGSYFRRVSLPAEAT